MKHKRSPFARNLAAVSTALTLGACSQVGCSTTRATPSTVVRAPESPNLEPQPQQPAEPQPSTEPQLALQATPQPFAFRLWNAQHSTGNHVMSPLNVETALAMTYAGANGSTALEMGRVLAGEGVSQEDYLQGAGAQYRSLSGVSSPGFDLRVANRLFLSHELELEPSFSERLRSSFASAEEVLDFSADSVLAHINGYIADQTNDRIRNLIPPGAVNRDTRLVLTAAIYMNAKWQEPFEVEGTSSAAFHTPTGDVSVPTMHQTSYFSYASGSGVELVQMPYEGGRFAAIVVLPNADSSLGAVEASLSDEVWRRWTTSLDAQDASRRVELALPKFHIAPETADLAPSLGSLGMALAISRNADFSRMSSERLYIGAVFHKAFIDVDEAGTEAAAATAVAMVAGSAMPAASQPFHVDRPFLFVVRDLQSNGVVFVARVVNPAL